jgi:probable non-F420 flavinoid oxidoreductase
MEDYKRLKIVKSVNFITIDINIFHPGEQIMVSIGYHASHEQFPPSEMLRLAQMAEAAGFQTAMCSDHFHPWSERQDESGFAWAWLGAALATTRLTYGVVSAPGQRYNPAIIAQAAATLAEMFPGRFWLAVGSGQLLNEHITGTVWPTKAERNARLREAVDVMRALWRGETVTHRGWFDVVEAKLYSLPTAPPLLAGAAITEASAEWVGGWADAVITTYKPLEEQQRFIEAFRRGGGEHKPMFLQAQVSYADDPQTALAGAHDQWRTNVLKSHLSTELPMPAQFDALATFITPEEVSARIRVSSDIERHLAWIEQDIALGFERIYLHNVNRDQERFIEVFGEHVLPQVQKSR